MKKFNFAARFGIVVLAMMTVSSIAFAGNTKYDPLPPPDLEDGPYGLQYGPLPPPDLEDGASYLKYGPLPPPDLEDAPGIA